MMSHGGEPKVHAVETGGLFTLEGMTGPLVKGFTMSVKSRTGPSLEVVPTTVVLVVGQTESAEDV